MPATQEPRCWAVLPAAGIGARMGAELPKQYLQVAGATLLEHSLRALLACERIAGVVVALHPQDTRAQQLPVIQDARVQTVPGGEQRSDSVLAGLDALSGRAGPQDWVLVHDAARPCLQATDIDALIRAVIERDTGGILAEPIVDTVKQASGDALVERTLDRTTLWRAQTPQMFRLEELRRALSQALARGSAVTDEASAMELAGYPVQLVVGPAGNLKVTVPEDLPLAAWYLQASVGGAA
ncbi:MAG: 2-C-methyl-D-erythritol 4-phosphate cytidylyltransferase [Halioglobus sp.]|nr:2-C-methyl-D-erythritol 4-phosphate cytidylyltransferase [Halioglobus sp.]